MKLFHAQFTNNIGQKIEVGDKVIVVRSDGEVLKGIYIGFSQRYRGPHRPYILADVKQNVKVWDNPSQNQIILPGKVRISSPSGKVYKLA